MSSASIKVNELFLSLDYRILVPESFVKVYNINIDSYFRPYGYFDPINQSLVYNSVIPDGVYVLVGKVDYPGVERRSYHTVSQYNILKIEGANMTLTKPMNPYIGLPNSIPFAPLFPLYRLGKATEYTKIKKAFMEVDKQVLTSQSIDDKLVKLEFDSYLYKLYAIKLALINYVNLERKLDGN